MVRLVQPEAQDHEDLPDLQGQQELQVLMENLALSVQQELQGHED